MLCGQTIKTQKFFTRAMVLIPQQELDLVAVTFGRIFDLMLQITLVFEKNAFAAQVLRDLETTYIKYEVPQALLYDRVERSAT
eukprot:132272-Pleurochrysis_carterae.AAC.1